MRDRLFYELGMRYPPLRFVVSDTLPENAFAFKIHAWPTMSRIGLGADQLLVNDTVDRIALLSIKGSAAINPGNGSECSVISTADGAVAESAGLTTWNEQDYLILCLSAELRRRAARFINVRTVEDDLRRLEPFPNLVGYAKEKIGLEQMARVLRNLVSEEVSIRNLRAILEHMLEFDYIRCDSTKFIVLDDRMPTKRKPEMSWLRDPRVLADFVRTRMKRYISDKYARGGSTLKAYLLDAGIEGLLERNEARGTELSETERDQVLAGIARELGRVPPSAQASPLLTTIEVRSALRKVTKLRFPQLPVLCYQELTPDSSIEPLARIAV